jgi:hypothetical protein
MRLSVVTAYEAYANAVRERHLGTSSGEALQGRPEAIADFIRLHVHQLFRLQDSTDE